MSPVPLGCQHRNEGQFQSPFSEVSPVCSHWVLEPVPNLKLITTPVPAIRNQREELLVLKWGWIPHPKLIRMVKPSVGRVSTFEHTSWSTGVESFCKKSYQLVLALDLLLTGHTSLVVVLGSKADIWLECGKYNPDIRPILVWPVPLAHVLPHPQLIFPFQNLVCWNLFEFSVAEIT
jgi:hypothetical protein